MAELPKKKQKLPTSEELAAMSDEPELSPEEQAYMLEQHHQEHLESQVPNELQQNPYIKAEHYEEDDPIFPGGPLYSELQAWKKQASDRGDGHDVYITQLSPNFAVIWRSLSRIEYKEIVSIPDTNPLQREEMICEQCVLWPQPFNYAVQSKGLAGVPSLVAEQIMAASGFSHNITYQPLF